MLHPMTDIMEAIIHLRTLAEIVHNGGRDECGQDLDGVIQDGAELLRCLGVERADEIEDAVRDGRMSRLDDLTRPLIRLH